MSGSGLVQRVAAGFVRARRRFDWLDHVARAVVRYDRADGGRLAAAVTCYCVTRPARRVGGCWARPGTQWASR